MRSGGVIGSPKNQLRELLFNPVGTLQEMGTAMLERWLVAM